MILGAAIVDWNHLDANGIVNTLGIFAGAWVVWKSRKAVADRMEKVEGKVDDVHAEVKNGVEKIHHVDQQLDDQDKSPEHETLRTLVTEIKELEKKKAQTLREIIAFHEYQQTRNHDILNAEASTHAAVHLLREDIRALDQRLTEFVAALLQERNPSPPDQTAGS